MLDTKEIQRTTKRCLDAWESGDPDRVLASYTDDVAYWDTGTEGVLRGAEPLRRHVASLLSRYDLRFSILEEHRLEGRDASMVMWQCALRHRAANGAPTVPLVMQRGMKLFEVRGDRVSRDESYMDLRSVERALAEAATKEVA